MCDVSMTWRAVRFRRCCKCTQHTTLRGRASVTYIYIWSGPWTERLSHTSSGAINAIIIDKLAPNPNHADFDKRMLRWLSRRPRFHNNTNDKPDFGLQDTYSNGKIALRFAPYKDNT